MIAVAPEAPILNAQEPSLVRRKADQDQTKLPSGRDIPELHQSAAQHPELSKFTQITEPKTLSDLPGAKSIAEFYKIGTEKPQAELF